MAGRLKPRDDLLYQLLHHLTHALSLREHLLVRYRRRLWALDGLSRKLCENLSTDAHISRGYGDLTSASTSSRTLRYCSGITTMLVTKLSTTTCRPSSCAVTTSGTVLIPTTSPPAARRKRPSAGVSYVGPLTHAYVPSARVSRFKFNACAARKTEARSEREYAPDSGKKRA